MTIPVPGVPASRKTPGVFFNVVLGGPGTSAGAVALSAMLLGNMIGTTITGASPALSVAAGTAAVATPVVVASESDAATLFGAGSELHRMVIAFFAQYPNGLLYACPVADAGGTAASGVLTFATTANAAGTVRLRLCGEVIDVPVASGDTATVIASAVCTYINNLNALPYTAQNSAGAVTLTAKQTGPRGSTLVVDAYFIASGAAVETRITTSSTASGFATTGIWSGTGTLGSEITLTSGATQDSFAAALSAIEPARYNRVVGACIDATNAGRISTALSTQAGPTVQKLEQAVVPSVDTYGNAVTFATTLNASRMQTAWHHASVMPAPDVAAQVAAARLAGDGALGGDIPGETSDPAANLNGVGLATILAQRAVADQPTSTEIENALNNGLTVLAPSTSRPGLAEVVKSITTRSTSGGVPNYAVLGTQNVTVPDYVADTLRAAIRTAYRACKLAPDTADGLPPRIPRVVTPSIVRGFLAQQLAAMEAAGILINVAANLPLLVVEINASNSSRLDCEIPAEVIPGLDIVAGNVRQL